MSSALRRAGSPALSHGLSCVMYPWEIWSDGAGCVLVEHVGSAKITRSTIRELKRTKCDCKHRSNWYDWSDISGMCSLEQLIKMIFPKFIVCNTAQEYKHSSMEHILINESAPPDQPHTPTRQSHNMILSRYHSIVITLWSCWPGTAAGTFSVEGPCKGKQYFQRPVLHYNYMQADCFEDCRKWSTFRQSVATWEAPVPFSDGICVSVGYDLSREIVEILNG